MKIFDIVLDGYLKKMDIQILFKKELMFFKAYDIEQEILKLNRNYRFYPTFKFKGHTEAIEITQKESVLSTLLEKVK